MPSAIETAAAKDHAPVHRSKIVLRRSEPVVWRRLQVPTADHDVGSLTICSWRLIAKENHQTVAEFLELIAAVRRLLLP